MDACMRRATRPGAAWVAAGSRYRLRLDVPIFALCDNAQTALRSSCVAMP